MPKWHCIFGACFCTKRHQGGKSLLTFLSPDRRCRRPPIRTIVTSGDCTGGIAGCSWSTESVPRFAGLVSLLRIALEPVGRARQLD